jgi:osmotically-inducible protein OsmY
MSLSRACRLFASDRSTHRIPLFAVVGGKATSRAERSLYRDGASIVFEWPREAGDIARILTGVLHLDPKVESYRKDDRLTKAVRRRLRVEGNIWGRKLFTIVMEGIAFVTGEVDALWKKRLALKIISEMPGIVDAFDRRILVTGKRVEDRKLMHAVGSIIKYCGLHDPKTVDYSVSGGIVHLTGSVSAYRQAERVEEIVANIEGVKGVVNMVMVSSWQKAKDHTAAKSIERQLRLRIPKTSVSAVVCGGAAILKGRSGNLAESRCCERIAGKQPGIRYVVNKIRITQ